jgi:hypothetical protein
MREPLVMKSLFSSLVTIALVLYVGHWFAMFIIGLDLMHHGNECHAELHIGDRINRQLDRAEIDELFDQYKACMQQKSNFIDRWFGAKANEEFIEQQRADRHANGPLNTRRKS